jgi:hypothetical protein
MSCRIGCRKLMIILALLAMAILAVPAFAASGTCVGDVSPAKSCSAGDVSIAALDGSSVKVFSGGIAGTNKCIAGGTFSFTADFEVKTTSSSTRSNVGVFFGSGQNNALHGTCTDAILTPLHPCAFVNGTATATCGDQNYSEYDQAKNGEPGVEATQASCGDTSSNDSSTQFGSGTHAAILEVDNVTCPTSGTTLALPVCTSWYQPAKGMPVCESPAPNYPWVPAAQPGAPSKCTCGIVNVPVQPITLNASVAKTCNTALSTGPGLTTCDAGVEGSQVTYHVAVTNKTTLGDIVVDSICDSAYGTVFAASGFSCPGGSVGSINSTTCSALDIPQGTTPGTCDFLATQGENGSVKNIVEVTYHSAVNNAAGPPADSNQVTVTSTDAPTTATTTLSPEAAAINACVTVRYDVTLTNTSGHDETITLNSSGTFGQSGFVPALNDAAFGDITHVHGTGDGSVVATTCNVFPQGPIAVNGGSYSCTFDGVICGTPAPIAGVCASGISKTDTGVTANLTGDDPAPNADTISETITPVTTDICVTPSGH